MTIDRDAVLWSAPEAERAGRPLLVLMHGLGSHEGDLFELTPYLPLEPVIASVRAPLPYGPGSAWFERGEWLGAAPAVAGLIGWLDSLEYTTVGLLGFSQGGAMALELLRAAPERFAYAVQLSGFVLPIENAGDETLARVRPPVFWARGTADEVIGAELIAGTQQWLPGHARLTERIYEGLGHGISQAELGDIAGFIRAQLA